MGGVLKGDMTTIIKICLIMILTGCFNVMATSPKSTNVVVVKKEVVEKDHIDRGPTRMSPKLQQQMQKKMKKVNK